MKISNIESARAGQVAPISSTSGVTPATRTADASNGATPAATVELSPQAQALTAAKTEAAGYVPTVNALPDRDDKIADLKSRIAAGTYQVSGNDIADQILRRAQADQLR